MGIVHGVYLYWMLFIAIWWVRGGKVFLYHLYINFLSVFAVSMLNDILPQHCKVKYHMSLEGVYCSFILLLKCIGNWLSTIYFMYTVQFHPVLYWWYCTIGILLWISSVKCMKMIMLFLYLDLNNKTPFHENIKTAELFFKC